MLFRYCLVHCCHYQPFQEQDVPRVVVGGEQFAAPLQALVECGAKFRENKNISLDALPTNPKLHV